MIKMRIITKVAGTRFKKANTNLEYTRGGKKQNKIYCIFQLKKYV